MALTPKLTDELVKGVREKTTLPLLVKLSPNVTDITVIARAAEGAGADGLSVINTALGMAIDINTRRPQLANVTGGLSGPAIKPIALRMVWQVYNAVSIPIIGMGGIMTGDDAVEFFIGGASAVAVGTANFINPRASLDVVDGHSRISRTVWDVFDRRIGGKSGNLIMVNHKMEDLPCHFGERYSLFVFRALSL